MGGREEGREGERNEERTKSKKNYVSVEHV